MNDNTDIIHTAESGTPTPATEEKIFTQEQLNAIVGKRLAEERAKIEVALAEREQALAKRELLLLAKEKIIDRGLPADFLDALNVGSPESLDISLEILKRYIDTIKSESRVMPSGVQLFQPHTGLRDGKIDAIRQAMDLK